MLYSQQSSAFCGVADGANRKLLRVFYNRNFVAATVYSAKIFITSANLLILNSAFLPALFYFFRALSLGLQVRYFTGRERNGDVASIRNGR